MLCCCYYCSLVDRFHVLHVALLFFLVQIRVCVPVMLCVCVCKHVVLFVGHSSMYVCVLFLMPLFSFVCVFRFVLCSCACVGVCVVLFVLFCLFVLIVCLMCLCAFCFPSVVRGVVYYCLVSCVRFVWFFVCVRVCARLFVALCVFGFVSRVCGSFVVVFIIFVRARVCVLLCV